MTRPFARPDVARVFARLDVGRLDETLRWGEPAYVTTTGSGSTIRIDRRRKDPTQYAMYFHCRTSLVDYFRAAFPDTFTFDGNRAIVFDGGDRVPVRALTVCITAALTYHRPLSRGRSRSRRG
jgi:hypothetical protein